MQTEMRPVFALVASCLTLSAVTALIVFYGPVRLKSASEIYAASPSSPRSSPARAASPQGQGTNSPASPAPAKDAPLSDSVAIVLAKCLSGDWPTMDDAEKRIRDCSAALQSQQLNPQQVALARLTRAVARSAMGNKVLGIDDYTDAVRYYQNAINPGNADAMASYRLAAAREGVGDVDGAISEYSQAIQQDASHTRAMLGRGVLLSSRERSFSRAIEDFNRVLSIEPNNVRALAARGDAYANVGKIGLALADVNRAITLSPGSADAYVVRARIRSRRGEAMLAMQDFDKAIQLAPQNPTALADRAVLLASEGRLDMAIQDLGTAISIDGANPVFFMNRGIAYSAKGDVKRAYDDYLAAQRLAPRLAPNLVNLCISRSLLGEPLDRAIADCDLAISIEPLNLAAHESKALVLLRGREFERAISEYDAVLAADPNRPAALYGRSLARKQANRGDSRDAEQDLGAALALAPDIEKTLAPYLSN